MPLFLIRWISRFRERQDFRPRTKKGFQFKFRGERTNPSWPTTWFAPRLTGQTPFDSVYEVMANWGANHGAICHGHIGEDLVTLASMLRIPVDMHNCGSVFRPSAWSRFGAIEVQSADYRACESYGPLYG